MVSRLSRWCDVCFPAPVGLLLVFRPAPWIDVLRSPAVPPVFLMNAMESACEYSFVSVVLRGSILLW